MGLGQEVRGRADSDGAGESAVGGAFGAVRAGVGEEVGVGSQELGVGSCAGKEPCLRTERQGLAYDCGGCGRTSFMCRRNGEGKAVASGVIPCWKSRPWG